MYLPLAIGFGLGLSVRWFSRTLAERKQLTSDSGQHNADSAALHSIGDSCDNSGTSGDESVSKAAVSTAVVSKAAVSKAVVRTDKHGVTTTSPVDTEATAVERAEATEPTRSAMEIASAADVPAGDLPAAGDSPGGSDISVDCREQLDRELVDGLVESAEAQLRTLAGAIGHDLANSSTAVQTHAQLLCEAIDDPDTIVRRCEELWTGVHRLRLLADKILTFATDRELDIDPVDVRTFLEDSCQELEARYGNSLEIQHSTAAFLPPILAHRRSLGNAMHFLVETLLELEPDTRLLSVAAYAEKAESDREPRIALELCVETHGGTAAHRRDRPGNNGNTMPLGYLAASNALEAQSANLSIRQTQGVTATAFISLEAERELSEAEEAQALAANAPTPQTAQIGADADQRAPRGSQEHAFGGILILERDESIRSLLTDEVERLGRTALNSIDATAARSLLEATPERFELLILEVGAPHGGAAEVLDLARERLPECPVLILSSATEELTADFADREAMRINARTLLKPFGVLELRAVLGQLLPIGAAGSGSGPSGSGGGTDSPLHSATPADLFEDESPRPEDDDTTPEHEPS